MDSKQALRDLLFLAIGDENHIKRCKEAIEKREDGTTWLFDDEPIQEFPFYGDGRDEWVEVDESTVVRM